MSFGYFEGQLEGRYSHEGKLWRCFSNSFLGTRSFTGKATVGSSRDYDLFDLRVFAKAFLPHDCFISKDNQSGGTLEVYMCN